MPRIIPIEIEPVSTVLGDGKTYKFLLFASGLNRLKAKFDVKDLAGLMALGQNVIPSILFEGLLDKGALTEEAFYDILPYQPIALAKICAALFNSSFPETVLANPTQALAEAPAASNLTN